MQYALLFYLTDTHLIIVNNWFLSTSAINNFQYPSQLREGYLASSCLKFRSLITTQQAELIQPGGPKWWGWFMGRIGNFMGSIIVFRQISPMPILYRQVLKMVFTLLVMVVVVHILVHHHGSFVFRLQPHFQAQKCHAPHGHQQKFESHESVEHHQDSHFEEEEHQRVQTQFYYSYDFGDEAFFVVFVFVMVTSRCTGCISACHWKCLNIKIIIHLGLILEWVVEEWWVDSKVYLTWKRIK